MDKSIIEVENISKKFLLRGNGSGVGQYLSIRDIWTEKLSSLFLPREKKCKLGSLNTAEDAKSFYAIKGLSFNIEKGDRLAIIGRNGAGKSTLLKILSRITEPTEGRIKIKGRVASLLEVGTGFHPELSGRENIFLNGSILGMSRREIRSKFDEIVDFADVEKFLDTPVKRYSSGMYVRLAFAVAAHLDPEILIVDEVLAVGDAQFQKKCLGKMQDVSTQEGRTVLFVSHNMAAVRQLCNKGILLEQGQLVFSGSSDDAVNKYQNNGLSRDYYLHEGDLSKALGNENIRITEFKVLPKNGDLLTLSSGVIIELIFHCNREGINLDATFELKTLDEIVVFHHGVLVSSKRDSKCGFYKVTTTVEPYVLNSGIYKFKLIFGEDQYYPLFIADDLIQFEILNEMKGTNAAQPSGVVFLPLKFDVDFKG